MGITQTHAENNSIKFILSSGPGSGADIAVDTYATCLNNQRISVLKDFKPGANGLLAINSLQQSKDTDKITNVMVGSFGVNVLGDFPGINLLEDIHPIIYLNELTMVLLSKAGGIESFDQIRSMSKTRPINIGYSSPVSTLIIETVFNEMNIPVQLVPYKNNVGVLTDTVNGSLDLSMDTIIGSKAMVDAKKLKVIASTFDKRTAIKYNHDSFQTYSKKINKMPLGNILSVNPNATKEAREMVINAVNTCNRDSDILSRLDALYSGPMFYTTEEIRNIVKSFKK